MGASVSTNHLRIIHYQLLDDQQKQNIVDSLKEFYPKQVTNLFIYDDHDDSRYYIVINTFKICFKYEHKLILIDLLLTLNRPFIFDEPYLPNSKGFWVKFIYSN